MAFFNDFKDKVNKAAQSVTNKTKDSVEISRLASEARNISAELDGLYIQIGRAYVDSNTEALAPLCVRVAELRARLEELERQKMQRKNQNLCPSCGAVMAKDARFCSNCGEKMPEPEPEIEPEIEPEAPEAEETEGVEDAEEPTVDTEAE